MHGIVVRRYGREEPLPEWDTVDERKLDSALHVPAQGFFGVEPYPTLEEKAAALLYSIAKAHAFLNGNKRMAMVSTFIFVAFNGHWWAAGGEEIQAHVTWMAASSAAAREQALGYMAAYFGVRLVPLIDVLGADVEVELEQILPP